MKKIFNHDQLDIRYSNSLDALHLKKWLLDQRQWYPIDSDQDVIDFVSGWKKYFAQKASLSAYFDQKCVGMVALFLMPYKKVTHHSNIYFVVDPKFTKKGIGTALLRNIAHLAKNYLMHEMINAEVFSNCPAISILEKNGFKQIVEQKKFVKDNGVYLSRILYQKNLLEGL